MRMDDTLAVTEQIKCKCGILNCFVHDDCASLSLHVVSSIIALLPVDSLDIGVQCTQRMLTSKVLRLVLLAICSTL